MPEYLFKCEKCEHEYTIVCSMADLEKNKKCVKCNSKKVYRRYDEELGKCGAHVPKTIGSYLDKVSSNMSKEEKAAIMEKARNQ